MVFGQGGRAAYGAVEFTEPTPADFTDNLNKLLLK